jgi:hypothetical protein
MSTTTVNATCINLVNFSFGTDPVTFDVTAIIRRVHDSAIRWGNTADVAVLYSDDSTQAQRLEYVWGAVGTAIFIFGFVLVWFILILTCMFLGPKRVGIFSGRHLKVHPVAITNSSTRGNITTTAPQDTVEQVKKEEQGVVIEANNNTEKHDLKGENVNHPSEMNDDFKNVHQEMSLQYRIRLNRVRIAVLMSSFGIVVSVILFLTAGIQSLVNSSNNVISSLEMGQELSLEAVVLIDDFVNRLNTTTVDISDLLSKVNNFCPKVTDAICKNITNSQTCNFTGIPVSNTFADAFENLIDSGGAIVTNPLFDARSDLLDLNVELGQVASTISTFNWAFIVAGLFSAFLLILNLCISYGIIAAWRRERMSQESKCIARLLNVVRHWLLVPIFVFLVVMSWIFSMIFVVGSVTSADLCYNSPDDAVADVLQKDVLPIDSTIRKFLLFYVKGCPADGAPKDLTQRVSDITAAAEKMAQLAGEFNNVSDTFFTENCGTDPNVLQATTDLVQGTICNAGLYLSKVVLFFSCENWRKWIRMRQENFLSMFEHEFGESVQHSDHSVYV